MTDLILVVEDDANIGELVCAYLEREGFDPVLVASGEEALQEIERRPVALVLLDVGLPGIDGLEVCRRIGSRVPVVMLTARDEVSDRIAGLELGADDYISKPFSPREMTARVKAVLRRARTEPGGGEGGEPALTLGPISLRAAAREVTVEGTDVELTQREFDLLEYLMRNRARVVGREELLEVVWGFVAPGQTRTVEVHVAALRRKLGHPELIRTVRGVGYRAVA